MSGLVWNPNLPEIYSNQRSQSPPRFVGQTKNSSSKVNTFYLTFLFNRQLIFLSFISYETLGLVASLNPTASGGMERRYHTQEPLNIASTLEVSTSGNSVAEQPQTAIPKGYGRIIRDANGNVVDIEMADDETDPQESVEHKLVEDIPDPAKQEDLAGWVALGTVASRKAEIAGTFVVQSKSFYLIKMLRVI